MRIPRIYQEVNLKEGITFALTHKATHHVLHVLRLSTNDNIIIFNGKGGEFSAFISKIEKKEVFVTIDKFQNIKRESPIIIHLGQSIVRSEKMDFAIQKAVELGVNSITPIITERSHTKGLDKKLEHFKGIIISSSEQCGRNTLPTLLPTMNLSDWTKKTKVDLNFILHPYTQNTINKFKKLPKEIALLIGPEGGFSEPEIQLSKQNGFKEIRLGQRILRTETATIAAISAMQTKWGDFY